MSKTCVIVGAGHAAAQLAPALRQEAILCGKPFIMVLGIQWGGWKLLPLFQRRSRQDLPWLQKA